LGKVALAPAAHARLSQQADSHDENLTVAGFVKIIVIQQSNTFTLPSENIWTSEE
jgi:hypothetical protein